MTSSRRSFAQGGLHRTRTVEAERKLKETPALLKMPSGYLQQNPWLTISNKQLELMHKYMSELGLSPVSRTRVSTLGSSRPKPWEYGRGAFDSFLDKSDPAYKYLRE